MVNSIYGISKRIIKGNKAVVISSILSIVISVALIISMFSLTRNAGNILNDELRSLYGNMDIGVYYSQDKQKQLTSNLITKIENVDAVEEVARLIVGNLHIGEGESQGLGTYSVGVDNSDLSKSRYKYKSNIKEGQIILNKGLADNLGVSIGDTVIVENRTFEVVEIMNDLNESANKLDIILVNINNFRELLVSPADSTHLMVDVKDSVKAIDVAKDLKKLDKDLVLDLFEEYDDIKANITSLNTFMIVLSVIVIIMCSLFVLSNFQIFLYGYRKQFALLRAIGGSSRQAFFIVLIQCTFINAIGIVLAILVSFLSNQFLQEWIGSFFFESFKQMDYSFPFALMIGAFAFIIIEIFMLIPSIKSSNIMPLSIVTENEKLDGASKTSKNIGILSLIASTILFIIGFIKAHIGVEGIFYGLFSSILLIIGCYLLFPFIIKRLLSYLIPVFKLIIGNIAVVAIKNVLPQVKKNAVIITAISTMTIITVFGATFFNTILKNDENYLRSQYALDLVVTVRDGFTSESNNELRKELSELKSIKNSVIVSNSNILYFKAGDKLEYINYVYMDFKKMIQEKMVSNFNYNSKNGIIVTREFADKYKLAIGDKIQVKGNEGNIRISEVDKNTGFDKLKIETIVESLEGYQGPMIAIDWSNTKYIDEFIEVEKAYISTGNIQETINELENLKGSYPQIKWSTLEQALNTSKDILYQRWGLFIIVILSILVTLVVGALNMLSSNIASKRKEYAILRTFNVDRKGLIFTLLTQVIVYNLIGIILGLLLGVSISNILTLCENNQFASISFQLTGVITGVIIGVSCIVFIPFGIYLGKRNIAEEIKFEAK